MCTKSSTNFEQIYLNKTEHNLKMKHFLFYRYQLFDNKLSHTHTYILTDFYLQLMTYSKYYHKIIIVRCRKIKETKNPLFNLIRFL